MTDPIQKIELNAPCVPGLPKWAAIPLSLLVLTTGLVFLRERRRLAAHELHGTSRHSAV